MEKVVRSCEKSEMPTVHHEQRMLKYPCFLKILERTSIHNSTAIVFLLNLCSPLVSSRLHFHNKKYFCGLLHVFMQHIGTSCCPLSSQVLATWRCSLLSFIPSILNGTVRINFVCDLDLYPGSMPVLITHSSSVTDSPR